MWWLTKYGAVKNNFTYFRASDLSRKKKSKISRDLQGQIRGKMGRFCGGKVKIRGKIG